MSTKTPPTSPSRPGQRLIFRPYKTLPNGKKLYASSVGKKAWPMWVPDNDDKK